MASQVRHPKLESRPRPRPAGMYLSFDNSSELRTYRIERTEQLRAKRQNQQVRSYKQLVRALNSALAMQTKTAKSSTVSSKRAPKKLS